MFTLLFGAKGVDFIKIGGNEAISTAATELDVTEEEIRQWWILWQRATRAPLRRSK